MKNYRQSIERQAYNSKVMKVGFYVLVEFCYFIATFVYPVDLENSIKEYFFCAIIAFLGSVYLLPYFEKPSVSNYESEDNNGDAPKVLILSRGSGFSVLNGFFTIYFVYELSVYIVYRQLYYPNHSFLIMVVLWLFFDSRNARGKEQVINIGEKGIKTSWGLSFSWSQIEDEKIEVVIRRDPDSQTDKYRYYLEFAGAGQTYSIDLWAFTSDIDGVKEAMVQGRRAFDLKQLYPVQPRIVAIPEHTIEGISTEDAIKQYDPAPFGFNFAQWFPAVAVFSLLTNHFIHVQFVDDLWWWIVFLYTLVGYMTHTFYTSPNRKDWFAWAFSNAWSVHELNVATFQQFGLPFDVLIEELESHDPAMAKFIQHRLDTEPFYKDDELVEGEYNFTAGTSRNMSYMIPLIEFIFLILVIGIEISFGTMLVFLMMISPIIYTTVQISEMSKSSLMVSEEGISYANQELHTWDNITQVSVERLRFKGPNYYNYLSIVSNGEKYVFNIQRLNVSAEAIRHIVMVYHYRSQQAQG